MERKAIRVNVEVVYDDGTLEELALDEPDVRVKPTAASKGRPVGLVLAGMLTHVGEG